MSTKSKKSRLRSKRTSAVKRARTLLAEKIAAQPKLEVPHRTDASEGQASKTPHIKPTGVVEETATVQEVSALDQAFADMPRVSPTEIARVDAAFSAEDIATPDVSDSHQLYSQLSAQLRDLDRQRSHLKSLLERIE